MVDTDAFSGVRNERFSHPMVRDGPYPPARRHLLPGAIQSFGLNGTEVWVGGVGSYNSSKDRSFSSPLLARLGGPGGATPTNLTTEIEPYFHDGGVFVPRRTGRVGSSSAKRVGAREEPSPRWSTGTMGSSRVI